MTNCNKEYPGLVDHNNEEKPKNRYIPYKKGLSVFIFVKEGMLPRRMIFLFTCTTHTLIEILMITFSTLVMAIFSDKVKYPNTLKHMMIINTLIVFLMKISSLVVVSKILKFTHKVRFIITFPANRLVDKNQFQLPARKPTHSLKRHQMSFLRSDLSWAYTEVLHYCLSPTVIKN